MIAPEMWCIVPIAIVLVWAGLTSGLEHWFGRRDKRKRG
jgi:hypothetical protein